MALDNEQAEKIKEHLLKQLSNFPEDKQKEITEQIKSMTPDQVENFIQKNGLGHLGGGCVFCSIVSGKTQAIKVGEDSNNVAILELNPLSIGHTLIVPRDHNQTSLTPSHNLARKVASNIQEKLNPKEIKTNELEVMEHKLLEVIPIYGNETERYQATESELRETQEKLSKDSIPEEPKEPKTKTLPAPSRILKFPPRIP